MSVMLSVLLVLLPQGDVRSAGRVVDVHGKPVANAKVLFLSRPFARSEKAGEEDRRTVTTDERGGYRIELDREHRYTAWASWSDGATSCAEGVSGGEFLELRGVSSTQTTRLTLPGLEKWPDAKTFTVRTVVGGENFDTVPGVRDGDGWLFPPLPPMGARAFEVLDANGEIRWCSTFSGSRGEDWDEVPELREWEVTVVDAQGKPLAGVELRWHICNYWYSASEVLPYGQRFRSVWSLACVTDADGEGTIRAPYEAQTQALWMIAAKDGYVMSQDGIANGFRFADGERVAQQPAEMNDPFRIVLQKSEPVSIDLREASGECNVSGWLACSLRVNISHKNGGQGTMMLFDVPIKEGKAVMRAPLPPGTEFEIVETRLSDELHAKLVKQHGSAPRRWRSLDPADLLTSKPGDDPFALHDPVRVQVTAVDGRPAARAVIMFQGAGGIQGVRTDRVGKAWLPGAGLQIGMIMASDEQGFALAEAASPDAVLKMQLKPFDYATVRVLGEDGKPAAGVGVRASSCKVVGESDLVVWGFGAVMGFRKMVVSDEDGWVKVAVPPFVCDMRLTSSWRVKDGRKLSWDPDHPGEHSLVVKKMR